VLCKKKQQQKKKAELVYRLVLVPLSSVFFFRQRNISKILFVL